MNKYTFWHAATFMSLTLFAAVLVLGPLSGGERAAASSVAAPVVTLQAGVSSSPKIVVIDIEKIMADSKLGRATSSALEHYGKQLSDGLSGLQTEVKDLQEKLAAARQSASPDVIRQLEESLQAKTTELGRRGDDAKRNFEKKQTEELKRIESTVMPLINQIAKEGRYELVFRKFDSGLIYADDANDITNVVIARLDAVTP